MKTTLFTLSLILNSPEPTKIEGFIVFPVADPDLQVSQGPNHLDPEIRGILSKNNFPQPFGP